jgi:hypothetical protein
MYLNRAAAREIAQVAWRHRRAHRLLTWLGYATGLLAIRSVLRLTRWIDDRLWPEIAAQKIEAPVFIFGNARSGTTLLHRLMALDEERFSSMKLYQSVFCAVSVRRSVEALDRFDRRVPGRPLRRLVDFINSRAFANWEGIHDMGLDQFEEDEALFAFGLMTPSVVLLLPYLDELPGVTDFDGLPEVERSGFLDSYEDALRRHLFASGGDRTYLSKNVLLTPRLRSMFERFPDARFIYPVRNPFDAIPSFLKLFHVKWVTHSPEIGTDSPEARALARLAIDYYRYSLDCRKFIPENRFITVLYDDLAAEPLETIEALYRRMGLEMSPSFQTRLDEALHEQGTFSSANEYSLEEFGLTEDWIYGELKEVFEEFGFTPPPGVET